MTHHSPQRKGSGAAADLVARSLAALWHPCTQMKLHEQLPPVAIARGEGAWLFDPDGNAYLDAISSWWVNLFGHCHPRISAAVADQLQRLEHVILAGFTHEPVVQLSERLARLAPPGLGHCYYASDGSSAVEIALKMSHHYWRNTGHPEKDGYLCLAGGYHGETIGTLSVGDVPLYREAYGPLLRPAAAMPSPDWRGAEGGETAEDVALRCAAALERHLAVHHARVAALIVEPLVQCANGMAMHHPVYLSRAREICDRYQVHLIADEIAVGFGRSGTLFACGQAGIVPDFLCLSKGLTGGYLPLSVTLTREAIYRAFYADDVTRAFLHSHSYTGNPLACRAALAVLDLFEEEDWIARNRATTAALTRACAELQRHPRVANFRNTGMIWAFEVENPPADFRMRFFRAALGEGLLLRPLGNTVYFMPPYVIGAREIGRLAQGTLAALQESL